MMLSHAISLGQQGPAPWRLKASAAAARTRHVPIVPAVSQSSILPGKQGKKQHQQRMITANTRCKAAASSLVQQADGANEQLVAAVAALPAVFKGQDKGTQLLVLLCAASVLATACTVLAAPGCVVCVLLLSGVAAMETFWKQLLAFQRARSPSPTAVGAVDDAASAQALREATASDLQLLATPPAEAAAWLASAQQGLWAALWQPLLDYREEWQEALMMDGPYAWAYDASGISVGSCTPSFSGVQAYCHPHTGALVAVEADMLLDTSAAAAAGSVDLQVHARGPIGKFCFSLESARVRGRVRLVPLPRHGQLLLQYVSAPAVDVAFSTAYPSRLPHDRSKLQQLDMIEEMLQGTLTGVLGSPDAVGLNYTAQFPASLHYGLAAAARATTAWAARSKHKLSAALHQHTPFGSAAAPQNSPALDLEDTSSGQQLGADGNSSACVSSSSSSASKGGVMDATSSDSLLTPKNSTVSESAALSLVAQQAAWRQKQMQQPEPTAATAAADASAPRTSSPQFLRTMSPGSAAVSNSSSSSGSSSDGHTEAAPEMRVQKPGWQLSGSVSEAVECWTSAGPTAKLSAVAAAAAATAPAAGSAAGCATARSASSAAVAVAAAALGTPCITSPHLHLHSSSSSYAARSGTKQSGSSRNQQTAQRERYAFVADSSSYTVPVAVLGSSTSNASTDKDSSSLLGEEDANAAGDFNAAPAAVPADEREMAVVGAGVSRKGGSGAGTVRSSVGVAGRQAVSSAPAQNKRSAVVAAAESILRFSPGPAINDGSSTGNAAAAVGAGAMALPPPDASRRSLLPWVACVSVALLGANLLLGRH